MPRKVVPIGPHVLALIEDARIDLALAALSVREGENELTFNLSGALPDQTDDEAVDAFKTALADARAAEDHLRKVLVEGGWLQ